MPLYTSNSDRTVWAKSWFLAIILAVTVLFTLEVIWRTKGHTTTIIDDQALWSLERNKLGKKRQEIALLGSSRILTDISPETLQLLFPGYTVANLAIDGSCANVVLHDLADDEKFKGIVLCDITTECILFGSKDEAGANSYIQYYKTRYNLNAQINRTLATVIQKNVCIVDPNINLLKIFGHLVMNKELPPPRYWTTHENRSQSMDYAKVKIDEYRAGRLQKVNNQYKKLSSGISSEVFGLKTDEIDTWVDKIQKRGGRVVLADFPISGEHWALDEMYFPKNKYWDKFASVTKAEAVHFKTVSALDKFKCPDTSHLDYRDSPEFTRLLFAELVKRNIFKRELLTY